MFDQNYIQKKYVIKEDKPGEEWNIFNTRSQNKSIFCDLEFINLDETDKKFFSIFKNKECVAKFFLILNKKEKKIVLSQKLIYTPIIYREISNQTQSSSITERNEILAFFAYFILENYKEAKFILDYLSNDMRPFSWINFITRENHFSIDQVKYTQVLNLKNFKDDKPTESSIYKNFSSRIKQSIKYTEEEGYKVIEKFDLNFFIETIRATFIRQNLKPDFDIEKRAKVIEKLYENKKIYMFISYDKKKIKACFSLFGVINDNAIYLHGGRFKELKTDNSLAHNLFKSMIILFKNFKVNTLDLEGVNSPSRAFFKAGFGGKLKPYYINKLIKK